MRKEILLLNIIIMLTFILTGCWDARELNTLGINLVMGIDIENDNIIITSEVIKPSALKSESGKGKEITVKYIQGVGKSVFEAIRNATLDFDRKLFVSHTKVYIIGEELAKKGMTDYIDFLQRDQEHRETAYLVVAKGSKAYDVMGISGGIEDIPGNYILRLIENQKYTSKITQITLFEYLRNYYDVGRQPILGVIEKKEKKLANKPEDTIADKSKGAVHEISSEGTAAFHKEKLVGYLNGEETRGLNFIIGKVKDGVIAFPTPITNIDEYSTPTPPSPSEAASISKAINPMSTVEIVKTKTKNDIEIVDGEIMFKTKIDLRGIVGEVIGDLDISKEEGLEVLQNACAKEIKKEVEKAFFKAQKDLKSDIFGFGTLFHRKYPKEWAKIKDNWHDIFQEANLDVEVNVNIVRTGLINVPTKRIKGK
jgi:spore germination protein KC